MTQAKRALVAIRTYLGNESAAGSHAKRAQVWSNVIRVAEGYDEEASGEADPSHENEIAVFIDQSKLWWNHSLQQWEAE
jgi:hypothetical protein